MTTPIIVGFALAVALWTSVGRNLGMTWARASGFGLLVALGIPLTVVALMAPVFMVVLP